jgi:WD40 repeat protein
VAELPPEDRKAFLRLDQRQRWQAGDRVSAEAYLGLLAPIPGGDKLAFDIIYGEFLLREELGEAPGLEEYLGRFPTFAVQLENQIRLHRTVSEGLHPEPEKRIEAPTLPEESVGWPTVPGYQIVEEIARGGMGIVYKAQQRSLQRVVALKVINEGRLGPEEAVKRFQREALAAARLSHPNIVMVYDAGKVGELHYIAMEYLEGIDLESLVEESGRLAVWQACDYVRQAAWGLQHAFERGMVHRDIKPANLIAIPVEAQPAGKGAAPPAGASGHLIKVLDMGLARFTEINQPAEWGTMTMAGSLVGTPNFMAPEQALDSHRADVRSDLYSLGCTFYYLLLGKPPYLGRSVMETLDMHRWLSPRLVNRLRPDVPVAVADIIRKLMAKRPEERFQTPAELAGALEDFLQTASALAGQAQAPAEASPTYIDTLTLGGSPTSVAGLLPSPRTTRRVKNLKGMLADALEKNETTRAYEIVETMLALDPNDSDVVAARAFLVASLQSSGAVASCRVFEGHSRPVMSVAFAADGRHFLSGSQDRSVRLWDVESGKQIRCMTGHTGGVNSVALSFDGGLALSGSEDKCVHLWELPSGRELRRFRGYRGVVTSVIFYGDARKALSASRERTVHLWELATGKELKQFKGHTNEVLCLAAAPKSGRFLSGGRDSSIRVWTMHDGREAQRFVVKAPGFVLSVAFSPDENLAVAGYSDGAIYLYDLHKEGDPRRWQGHAGRVTSAVFTPDGQHILSGGQDRTVRLWDAGTGQELLCLKGHGDEVTSVAVSPEGRAALSSSLDGTVRLWGLPQ